jgi:CheY-like chemotaxis protein
MLLDLSEGIDGDRARSTEALEASFASAEDAPVGDPVVPATVFEADMEAAEQELVETPPEPPAGYPGTQEGAVPRPPRPGSDTRPYMPVRPIPPSTADGPRSPAPSPPTRPAQPPPARTILLVDDEEDVRRILGRHFAAAGFRIEEAGNPDSALKAAGRLRGAKEPFVLVTDLGMPSSGGASFHGGFEVVKRLWKMNLRPPVLMMTESLGQSLRLRARQMGVRSFVFKPTLSKLNAQQFEADLSAFAGKIVAEVLPRLAEGQAPVAASRPGGKAKGGEEAGRAAQDAAQAFPFLRRRLVELRQGKDASHVAALVMKVAREFFERAVLFVIRNEKARGLGGFGLAPRDETLHLLAREITIPLDEPSVFRDVALERRLFQGPPPPDRWAGHLLGRIGRFHSGAVAILPLVAHRETIALLFGDNPETGRAPAGLESLDVFMRQAGTALENISLQRKLQAMEDKGEAGLG